MTMRNQNLRPRLAKAPGPINLDKVACLFRAMRDWITSAKAKAAMEEQDRAIVAIHLKSASGSIERAEPARVKEALLRICRELEKAPDKNHIRFLRHLDWKLGHMLAEDLLRLIENSSPPAAQALAAAAERGKQARAKMVGNQPNNP